EDWRPTGPELDASGRLDGSQSAPRPAAAPPPTCRKCGAVLARGASCSRREVLVLDDWRTARPEPAAPGAPAVRNLAAATTSQQAFEVLNEHLAARARPRWYTLLI